MNYRITRLEGNEGDAFVAKLVLLFQDVVHNGSSLGFLPPLTAEVASAFWREILAEVAEGERVFLVASVGDEIVGGIQLSLAKKQNAQHRAEVQKLMVHSNFRKQGIASALLREVDKVANSIGRTLLFLDTEAASDAERLYPRCGYTRVGEIPQYARSVDHSLITTVIFYKLLEP